MGDVVVMDVASGRATTALRRQPAAARLRVGDLKPITWRSFDGMEIWGLLLTPPAIARRHALPTLVYIHGGPGGGFTYGLFPQFMHLVPQVDPYPTATMASARLRGAVSDAARRRGLWRGRPARDHQRAGATPTTRTS